MTTPDKLYVFIDSTGSIHAGYKTRHIEECEEFIRKEYIIDLLKKERELILNDEELSGIRNGKLFEISHLIDKLDLL